MELHFNEIDNLDNKSNINNLDDNTDNTNYWEQNIKQKKKVRFSYDDILSSLNLVVNHDGALQYMTPINNTTNQESSNKYNQIQKPEVNKIQPMKNSYIYNKYFKDYKDPNQQVERKIPQTQEEYRQMIMEEKIQRINAVKRAEQIHSKKMLFSNNMPIKSSQKVTNLNHIFRM